MKNFTKYLILENDIEETGLPDMLTGCLRNEPKDIQREVWWWFSEDVRQNKEESIKRFASLDNQTLIISYPSFVGYSNSFESYLHLFTKLKELDIKLNITIFYWPDFYSYLIGWMHDNGVYVDGQKRKAVEIENFKQLVEFHNLYYVDMKEAYRGKNSVQNSMIKIDWKLLEENYYPKGTLVKINSTGEERKVYSVYGKNCEHYGNANVTFYAREGTDRYSSSEDVELKSISKTSTNSTEIENILDKYNFIASYKKGRKQEINLQIEVEEIGTNRYKIFNFDNEDLEDEDHWATIIFNNDKIDINFYLEGAERKITAYCVENGMTRADKFKSIKLLLK